MKISSILALALFCVALAPAVATADDQQGQQACMSDAMTVCSQFIPDRQRVAAVLSPTANASRSHAAWHWHTGTTDSSASVKD
jgi:hypothetical protein